MGLKFNLICYSMSISLAAPICGLSVWKTQHAYSVIDVPTAILPNRMRTASTASRAGELMHMDRPSPVTVAKSRESESTAFACPANVNRSQPCKRQILLIVVQIVREQYNMLALPTSSNSFVVQVASHTHKNAHHPIYMRAKFARSQACLIISST